MKGNGFVDGTKVIKRAIQKLEQRYKVITKIKYPYYCRDKKRYMYLSYFKG